MDLTNFILIFFSLLFILFVFAIFTFVCFGACFGYLLFSKIREFIGLKKSSSYLSVEASAPIEYNEDEEEAVYAEAYLCPPLIANQHHQHYNENANEFVARSDKKYHPNDPLNPDLESNSSPSNGYRDVIFAVLFVINIIIIIYFAIKSNENIQDNEDKLINYSSIFSSIIIGVLVIGIILTFLGTIWLSILLKYSNMLIEAIIKFNIISSIVMSIIFLFSGNIIFSVLLGFVAVLNYFYFQSVKDRIPFASAIIKTSSECISHYYYHIIITSYFLLFIQCCWLIIWSKAFYNISMYTNNNNNNNNNNNDNIGIIYFLLILSLCWGIQIFQALLQTTVAGTIGCWWFQPHRPSVVSGSLFRSCTTSFGSICLGSLFVSIIQALRTVLNSVRNNRRGRDGRNRDDIFSCIMDCLLQLVEKAIRYFNKYAYCYIALWGLDYMQSGSKVMELFSNRGWTALINDNLVDNALIASCFSFAVVSTIIGALISFLFPIQQELLSVNILISPLEMFSMIGLIIGFIIGSLLTHIIKSGVATVFVCLAEDPYALQANHPNQYQNLASSWNFMYPNSPLFIIPNHNHHNNVQFQHGHPSHNQMHQHNIYQQQGHFQYQNQMLPVANVI